ncbi:phosphonopyruvate decarboxylase [Methanosphaera sp. BMS]|uniref:phosphonopyruvate decarboxylase n=1 Tax=Methanosphaera sp. BMS TaxID=1789762 RepID=UPI000DC1E3CA|nr:phosphonopyruvate decarboxylase [Methanosphaera sp. BMS]AWX32288.1 phosphonopyruvate decarboxylase [Methanosphaera sp. BMS]
MINVKEFEEFLQESGVGFYTGVPDSQLKAFCDYLEDKYSIGEKHIIAANEGNAVALATGYHLSTGKYGLVYMQNSGLGNAVNPITSLTHPEVYDVPVVYVVGWRGEPGVKDEPQHVKQGAITTDLLEMLDVNCQILTKDTTMDDVRKYFEENFKEKLAQGDSIAYVVSKGAFESFKTTKSNDYTLSREDAIKIIVDNLTLDDMVVSTTGKASRELFEYREELNQGHSNDFLTVGSMGHSSSIALSIALNHKDRRILCFDGDGALLMHMGSMALVGANKPANYYHVLFNNEAHETVGGLPTVMGNVDVESIAISCGYNKVFHACSEESLTDVLAEFLSSTGPVLLIVDVSIGSRSNLGRPTTTPIENKQAFMKKLQEN